MALWIISWRTLEGVGGCERYSVQLRQEVRTEILSTHHSLIMSPHKCITPNNGKYKYDFFHTYLWPPPGTSTKFQGVGRRISSHPPEAGIPKNYCAADSAWPEVELRICPWLLFSIVQLLNMRAQRGQCILFSVVSLATTAVFGSYLPSLYS